ncbi:MAG: Glycosyl hydrolase family 3 [Candidatus Ozemobacter sibiricus]|uniref:beta-glucosidase n=1 Tax=Candidatus Ozemobacter sibiricus TaxID=2268124 RepID=A0A367ZNW8_9BACT|nr:MAG: Glycosyl hydrolase family 3 [Candidatus Ozemobacter sibiricus]
MGLYRWLLIVAVMVGPLWPAPVGAQPAASTSEGAGETRIDRLLERMTLDEKIGQMTLFTSTWAQTGPTMDPAYLDHVRAGRCGAIFNAMTASYTRWLQRIAVEETRLGIPLLFGYDVIHGHRTIFPIPLAESCSWDLAAIEQSARIAAIEAAAEGIHWTFAPMVDIARDPRWGRIAEGAGEDVWLACRIAEARVRGFQGTDLRRPDTIAACAKHFAAYGAAQAGRDYHTADVSERTLEEVYLPPFEACVKAGVRTVMTAFNEIAGHPCTAHPYLLSDLLRGRWGFTGMVVSDYTAINELVPHGYAADEAEAGRRAVLAGVDMDMQGAVFLTHLRRQVERGEVPMARLDEAVRRILTLKEELGLFDDPYRYCDEAREKRVVFSARHQAAARAMARRSMVLLKNDGGVLPLRPNLRSLAVIGPLAEATVDLLGNWHAAGDGSKVVSILQAVRERVGPGCQVRFAKGCEVEGHDRSGFRAALAAARDAEAVLLVLGERENMSGEAASRVDIDLPGVQNELAEAIARLGRPTAAVLLNGRPLALTRLHAAVPAILEAWFPGSLGGRAVADVVFGDHAPSGKLTVTFPRHVGQIPIYYSMKNTGRPLVADQKYTSRYLDCPNTPLYPFGHGLTYTTFAYSDLQVEPPVVDGGKSVTVRVTVRNTGSREGEEVVQCYLRDLAASVTRPVKELRGFRRLRLAPGASATIEFTLGAGDLSFRRADGTWGWEPGEFRVMVGGSSDLTLEGSFHIRDN